MRVPLPYCLLGITLLPLGFGHTLFGYMGLSLVLMVAGLSLSIFLILVWLSAMATGPRAALFAGNLGRLFFASPQKFFVPLLALVFFCTALAINYFSNGCVPAIQDSVGQFIHARILLSGEMSLPASALDRFFDLGVMVSDGRYYSQYPPGHMFLLAAGLWLGAPCAVNPLLGALSCVVIFYLCRLLYQEKTARLAMALCVASPFMLIMSSEFMNHASALLFASLFFLSFLHTIRKPSLGWSLLAGLSFGYFFMVRPLTAVGIGFPFALYGLYLFFREPRRYLKTGLCMLLGVLPPLLAFAWFNLHTTGDPLLPGYSKMVSSHYGFGPIPESMLPWVMQPVHTLWHGIGMAFNNLNGIQWHLFLWPCPSLLFVPLAFIGRRAMAEEKLLLAACVSLLLVYVPYCFQGWGESGPRYLYELLPVFIILTACGILRAPEMLPLLNPRWQVAPARLAAMLGMCVIFAAGFTLCGLAGEDGREQKLLASRALAARIARPAIVFMPFSTEYWRLAAQTYPVREGSPLIIARDRAEENHKLMERYPSYEVYRARNIGTPEEQWDRIR